MKMIKLITEGILYNKVKNRYVSLIDLRLPDPSQPHHTTHYITIYDKEMADYKYLYTNKDCMGFKVDFDKMDDDAHKKWMIYQNSRKQWNEEIFGYHYKGIHTTSRYCHIFYDHEFNYRNFNSGKEFKNPFSD